MCRVYQWILVYGFFVSFFSDAAEKPSHMIYVKDFVRAPGLLSEFGCPDDITPEDLIKVGLYPVGFIIENNGREPFVISEKTFRFPAVNLATVAPALCKKQGSMGAFTPFVALDALIISSVLVTVVARFKHFDVASVVGGMGGLAYYLARLSSDRQVERWLKRVSRRQSGGGSILVLPGRSEKLLLLLTRGIYTSSFPIFFDSFPTHEFQAVIPISLTENNADELRMRMYSSDMPDATKRELRKEIDRLSDLPAGSYEAPGIRAYIEWVLELPWGIVADETQEINQARTILDAAHYGLSDVKERILDIIAMRIRSQSAPPPIICLVGPPGTGKTSLARAIAKSLGRPFERISVGGVDDEADIRGHRRTYVGAIPGRIMTAINHAQVVNPVILIDEIDKMGSGRSDAARAAILEVLDPEQNSAFRDHYLGVQFDCSQVLFIATANNIYDIPAALIDRMEIIQLSSYTQQEKVEIVKRHLLPRALKKTGLDTCAIDIASEVVELIISQHTSEAGIRELDRLINTICMKLGRLLLEGQEICQVTREFVEQYLGCGTSLTDMVQKTDAVGIVNGLAWTSAGGIAFPIEAVLMPGTGELILTGKLGDVMQESAKIALSYVRSHAAQWKIDPARFASTDIHIHVPAGALPKDGPSAGIALATTLVSAFTNRKVDCRVAMTGEIDLPGCVWQIGGLKEKLLAAKRNGISRLIVPARNKVDIKDIQDLAAGIELIWVDTIEAVLDQALCKPI